MKEIKTEYAYLVRLDKRNLSKNQRAINEFRSERFPSGETFLKEEAGTYVSTGLRYVTYLVKSLKNKDILGYFTLATSCIFWEPEGNIKANPAIEISFFSVNDEYALQTDGESKVVVGLGRMIFNDFIMPTIKEIAKDVGCSIVLLFAIPSENNKVIEAYENMGFILTPIDVEEYIQDLTVRNCRLMIYNLFKKN